MRLLVLTLALFVAGCATPNTERDPDDLLRMRATGEYESADNCAEAMVLAAMVGDDPDSVRCE